jgi:ubiquitin-conjugating enzyme E2 variant
LSPTSPESPRKPWIDRASVVVFAGAWGLAFARFDDALLDPDFVLATAAGGLAGYLLADLVAGTVHWIADRHFDPGTRWLGPMLIEPFRAHHADPLSITRHDLFEVLGNNALVTIPAVVLLAFAPRPETALGHLGVALAISGTLAAVATNLFHAWAHAPRPPRLARLLHATGLILTPARHARHHRGAHDRAYCVTSGWLNPLLDRARIFAGLDALMARLARWTRGARIGRRPRPQGQTARG